MNKLLESFRGALGIFNILWFLVLSFMSLGSQFQLIFYLFLGIGYLILAIQLFSRSIRAKNTFFFCIIPISILAVLNIIVMGSPLVASYFRMTFIEQIVFTMIFAGFPLVLNAIYILKSPVGKFIAGIVFIVLLVLISRLTKEVFKKQSDGEKSMIGSKRAVAPVRDDYK